MMLSISQEYGKVEKNTTYKNWVELDFQGYTSELGWWTTPHIIDDDIAN